MDGLPPLKLSGVFSSMLFSGVFSGQVVRGFRPAEVVSNPPPPKVIRAVICPKFSDIITPPLLIHPPQLRSELGS